MHAHIFFSVHDRLFDPVARQLRDRYGVDSFSGFVWGHDQAKYLARHGMPYRRLDVFTRDVLGTGSLSAPDRAYLTAREQLYGVSIHRMLFSERHLRSGRSYDELLTLVERVFRMVESTYDNERPDFIFSEDVSCLTSYIHWAVARGMGIPYWCIGHARMPDRLSIYADGLQHWRRTNALFHSLCKRELSETERLAAATYVDTFRKRPTRFPGMETRTKLPVVDADDVRRFALFSMRYLQDHRNPTLTFPLAGLFTRARRLVRSRVAPAFGLFEKPDLTRPYVAFPIHFQPEASTLVQAPYYLDQIALIADVAKSLPVGYELYVKEHVSNRGRRPLSFYRAIKEITGVRLLGPEVDSWELIRNAAAVAVITGTMGWEALLFGIPAITFGDVFYNEIPLTHRAGLVAKDGWNALFRKAIFEYQHDEEIVLKFISAIQQTSHPGFVKNPLTFPRAMEPANVQKIADALAAEIGLTID